MRVLICALNFAPEPIGAGKRTFETARRLARAGHEVRVVTAYPYYPEWRVADGFRAWRYQKETMEGVGVLRCPLWVPRSPGSWSRLIHLLSFSLSAIPVLGAQVFWRPEAVIAVCPTIFSAPAALATARIARSRAVLHVHDLELDAALSLGMLEHGWAASLARRFEAWLFRRFDKIFAVSQGMAKRIEQKGVLPGKIVFLPNGVDRGSFQPRPDSETLDSLRKELGIPNDTVVAL
ncbi:MAG: WcaI family glycosyltransferase, partial [Thermodesulfobacteriota bacterium]|nr:WcaI family glycosyltransferase [Thermodesulfobacteriota bacterium]